MSSTIRKIFIALLVVVLIGVAGTAYYYYLSPRSTTQQADNNQSSNQDGFANKQEVPSSQNPQKFPTDIPIESGAVITQNYNASTEDGRFQATREFQTSRTLAENLATYRTYMNGAGWEVRSTVDQDNYKMIFGVKGNADLQISMDYNSELDVRKVTIFYTEFATR